MFEVAASEVQQLDDSDLRELIARLCKAKLEKNGISPKYVTWGGEQTAPDGGEDVTVESPAKLISDYIPHKHTVFQVKKEPLIPSKIEKEMKPKGKIRSFFNSFSDGECAYIIASSGKSLTKQSVHARVAKMNEILAQNQLPNIETDFLCSRKIADWVETFPSLVVWVKNKCGVSLSGWRSYDNWSNHRLGVDAEYVVDAKSRIEYRGNLETIENGISLIRERLKSTDKSLRIIGKSGVGKTRFLQAIFDERIGDNTPSTYQVLYADMGGAPSPMPVQVIEALIKAKRSVVVVLDNCSSSDHKRITEICTHAKSTVSLITVE